MWASVRRKILSGSSQVLTQSLLRASSNLTSRGLCNSRSFSGHGYLGFSVCPKPSRMDFPFSMLIRPFSSEGSVNGDQSVKKHVVTRLPFVDAFLLKAKKQKDLLANRKIWSRRSVILPEFVGYTFRIYNGRTFFRCKITEGKVGHKFGEFAFTRKRRNLRSSAASTKKKGKR